MHWDFWRRAFSFTKVVAIVRLIKSIYRGKPHKRSASKNGLHFWRHIVKRPKAHKQPAPNPNYKRQSSLSTSPPLSRRTVWFLLVLPLSRRCSLPLSLVTTISLSLTLKTDAAVARDHVMRGVRWPWRHGAAQCGAHGGERRHSGHGVARAQVLSVARVRSRGVAVGSIWRCTYRSFSLSLHLPHSPPLPFCRSASLERRSVGAEQIWRRDSRAEADLGDEEGPGTLSLTRKEQGRHGGLHLAV